MKVLAYLASYPPLRLLGGELMTSELLEALVEAGHEVTVVAQAARHPFTRNGVQVVPRRGHMIRQRPDADVFLTHPEIAPLYAPRVTDFGVPYVGIVHNLNAETITSLARQRPHLTIANAEATAAALPRSAGHVEVMHPPVLPSKYRIAADLPPTFVTLVNLSVAKGGLLFYELAASMPHVPFLGVRGAHGEQVEPPRDLPNVTLLGQTEGMALVYALTRVLLFASSTETYGKVAAEAMVCGVPAVAHRLPGVVEALGEGPQVTYADRRCLADWQGAVERLMGHDVHRDAAAAARERGRLLAQRSRSDLARFVALMEDVATRQNAHA